MVDWNTVIATILASSSVTAIILAVLGFLTKSIFVQLLAKDIEKYKIRYQVEVEQFRSDLQKSAFEHEIRYQSLHTRRAEIIAELYRLLIQAEKDIASLVQPVRFGGEPSLEEQNVRAFQSGKSLHEFFEQNRIYFTQDICERIAGFIRGLYHSQIEFRPVLESLTESDYHRNGVDTDKWFKVWKKLTDELQPIKADIEAEFREILGL